MSEPGVNSRNSPPSVDVFIAAIATRQHGLIALVQLLALGLTRSAVTKRERAGRLHRIHRGVYAVGHPRLSQEGKSMALCSRPATARCSATSRRRRTGGSGGA